ncbi:unnamed protein product [Allacma fusca]|uniref:Protein kinase domain-containing protein n=1 Tax=Allacma fusca TaxID=39272 RepID=A0A8J2JJ11_9HEXA|nr:unnamed protein product [Allacma fusca]
MLLTYRQKTLCPPGSISCSLKNGSYELKVQQCFPHQFRCLKNNNCIDVTLQCDNSLDCGPDDSSDEENCEKETNTLSSCSRDEFQCLMNKECISRRYVCDGDYDCKNPDTSDEEGCRAVNGCHFAQFPCTKGNNCIPDHLRCDGNRDCKDGSDESNCMHNTALVCNATEFQCSVTKKCIPLQYICDDYNDCGTNDLSDELNCRDSHGCHPTQFGCQLGNKCIAGHLKCNGEDDCPDRSDESNCSTNATVQSNCSSEEFQCTVTRKCISVLNDVCDGRYDCGALDTSDEDSCKEVNGCHRSQFACHKGNKCIPRYSICDGSNDCRDGSDEENCPDTNLSPNCSSNEFRCGITNKCIHSNKVCDGERDCGGSDESDEENCRTSDGCHWSQFPCRRGNKCIPNPLKCDGNSDCKDGSDEEYCDPKNKFSCPKGQLKCAGNQQHCYNLRDTCDGNDDCAGLLPSDEQNCTVGTNGCRWTQFACLNIRECIRGMYKCDGDKDCTDGSDEENCHTLNSCHSTQFTCKNGTGCIRGDKRCDDEVDCADGSDEENCADLNECNWRQFACHDKSGCIPGHFKCNGQNDCLDGSDEEDCGAQVTSTLTTTLIIGYLSIPLGLVIVFGCILSVVCFKYRRQQDRLSALEIKLFEMGDEKQLKSDKYAHENAQFIPYNRNYEVKWKEFRISDEDKLGEGTYGIVFKGCLVESPNGTVAVKTVRSEVDKSVLLALLSELKVMIYLGQNENIVRLVGACTEFLREGRAYVLVEYCPMGSLESYLREKPYCINDITPDYVNMVNTDSGEEMLSTMDDIISRKDLVSWAIQIARGMQHLQNKKVIHGDLASRNVLLYTKDRVKITDFGLSRQLLNYENYVKKSQALLPWRWLALETLKTLAFTSKSDVWAYGITLWEIFSLGLIPYPGMVWTVDFVDYLEQNHRLSIPKYADEEIYNIMTRCWEPDPKNRPDFEQLEEMLQTLSK